MVVFGRDRRGENTDHFGWHITTGPGVKERINNEFVNNLMVAGNDYSHPLLFVWQKPDQCEQLKEPSLSKLNNNVYTKLNNYESPVILLHQKINDNCESSFSTSNELNQVMEDYAANSLSLIDYKGPLFKSIELKNFELIEGFKGAKTAIRLPEYIEHITRSKNSKVCIGAYTDNLK